MLYLTRNDGNRTRSGGAPGADISIAIIASELSGRGGVNRVVSDLSALLSAIGINITIFTRDEGVPSYTFPDQVQIERRPKSSRGWRRWMLYREIRQARFDAVIGLWFEENIRIPLAFVGAHTRVILMEHTSWFHAPLKTRLVRRITYRLADAIIVLNPKEQHYYRKFHTRVKLIPNPVNRNHTEIKQKENLIIGVGHLIDRKNFHDAIIAFGKSGLGKIGWKLVLIGDGPELLRLETLAKNLENVEFQPETSAIDSWYSRAKIIMCTSRIEVFSLALAEATVFGVVPLSYDVDGPAFVLRDFQFLLVEPGNTDILANKLREIAQSDRIERYSELVRTKSLKRFSFSTVSVCWRQLFSDLSLGSTSRAAGTHESPPKSRLNEQSQKVLKDRHF
jgi:GalNAc-alpha-(1->4)-GalNAc-alpha-(1->3)-diNAcBac-PP-undecaprenol alpha-1,4-N-acetyl-D-galactosaminyltransferase